MPEPSKLRVFIRFRSDDVPGNPQERHMTLAESFYSTLLHRSFDEQFDYLHVPANIDSSNEKCWMIIDFNVSHDTVGQESVGQEPVDLEKIPTACFKATWSERNRSM